MVIDENGNLNRYNKSRQKCVFDSELGVKMNEKKYLLQTALESSDYAKAPIYSLVVFTNSTIKVENRFPYIKVCSLGSLPSVIGRGDGYKRYFLPEITNMVDAVKRAETHKKYAPPKEVLELKADLLETLSILEAAQQQKAEKISKKQTFICALKYLLQFRFHRFAKLLKSNVVPQGAVQGGGVM